MKNKINKRILLVLALCVACVLGFGVTFAQASVDSGLGGPNELTVGVAIPEADLGDAPIQVDVYRIATGSKDATYDTYNYTFDVEAFKGLAEQYRALAADTKTSTEAWDDLAASAKKIVDDNHVAATAHADGSSETITGLPDGIYLVWIPDTASDTHTFTFKPALVVLPGKVGADNTPVYQTSEGEWTNTVTLYMKGSMKPRYGSLQIDKTVTDFNDEAATFVFHIVDTDTGGQQYENYAAVQYTAEGVQSTTVGHIPAGMTITVTEVNSGARYQLVSENDQTVIIEADQTATVDFTNEPNDSGKGGHGIENHFVFDEETNGGDWQLEVRTIDNSEVSE